MSSFLSNLVRSVRLINSIINSSLALVPSEERINLLISSFNVSLFLPCSLAFSSIKAKI